MRRIGESRAIGPQGRRTLSFCGGDAFTLVELLVVVAIIGVLVGLLLPVIVSARESSRDATCKSNMHQMGMAFEMYIGRYGGYFPGWHEWKTKLVPFAGSEPTDKDPGIFGCPTRPELPWYYGHGYNIGIPFAHWSRTGGTVRGFATSANAGGVKRSRVRRAEKKIVIAEWNRCLCGPPIGIDGFLPPGVGSISFWAVVRVHQDWSNVLFADWHVEGLSPDTYHSATEYVDDTGVPHPDPDTAGTVVPEEVWRRYWDVDYGG